MDLPATPPRGQGVAGVATPPPWGHCPRPPVTTHGTGRRWWCPSHLLTREVIEAERGNTEATFTTPRCPTPSPAWRLPCLPQLHPRSARSC